MIFGRYICGSQWMRAWPWWPSWSHVTSKDILENSREPPRCLTSFTNQSNCWECNNSGTHEHLMDNPYGGPCWYKLAHELNRPTSLKDIKRFRKWSPGFMMAHNVGPARAGAHDIQHLEDNGRLRKFELPGYWFKYLVSGYTIWDIHGISPVWISHMD